jgi:hypothetical protein
MRGRKPRSLRIAAADFAVLHWLARGEGLPCYQARRAQILLAVAGGESIGALSTRLAIDGSTVWRLCRRYERAGLSGVLADGRRKNLDGCGCRCARHSREAS